MPALKFGIVAGAFLKKLVPRGGLKQLRPFNYLSCPTLRSCPIAFQGVFLTLSHRFLRLSRLRSALCGIV
jgi:hypothetical protein